MNDGASFRFGASFKSVEVAKGFQLYPIKPDGNLQNF